MENEVKSSYTRMENHKVFEIDEDEPENELNMTLLTKKGDGLEE